MKQMKFYTLYITLILIAVFILQQFIPNLTETFVLNQDSIPQIWRFVTAIFLHGSPAHLVSNLFALIIFGLILEKLIGSNRFLIVFFISGILANIVALNFYSNSLGASGSIMGIIGALAIIRPLMAIWAFGMIVPMFIAAIIWIFIDLIGIFIPSNIGHIAHLSGIAFGMILGIIFKIKNKKLKKRYRHNVEVPEHLLRRWETLYMDVD